MKQIAGWFSTREAADLATEHLVQEHEIDRSHIVIAPAGEENVAGERVSGGDTQGAEPGTSRRADASLGDSIRVSVDVDDAKAERVREELERAGAVRLQDT